MIDLDLDCDLADLQAALCRADLTAWCEHVLHPFGQMPARHHRLLLGELDEVASGACDRLMVAMPPGSAKSTYCSILFAAWMMRRPQLHVIGASHTATLAEDFSRRVNRIAREHSAVLGYVPTNEAGDLWSTTVGSRYRAVGVGGAVTGSRADLVIVDDPVKGREDADSDRMRDRCWDWYRADLLTRLKPGGRIVLVMTRWHEADLAGRLLEAEADRWRVLRLPALADGPDPLGRAVGEPLWPEWEGVAALEDKRRSLGEREWGALFQQRPTSGEGGLFQVAVLGVLEAAVPGRSVRAWDLAATEQVGTRDPDWTVGCRLTRTGEGRFVVDDVVRVRGGPDLVEAAIVATASVDGRAVSIGLPQDPGQAGKAQVLYLTRKLVGYRVESSPETGDKSTRAAPVASQCNVGNLSVVRAPWNTVFREELAGFPAARHDDCVDALSRAFAMLIPSRSAIVSKFGY